MTACLYAVALSCARPALALDKQGSAHGGEVAGADEGFGVSGSLTLGSALYNPTYAARPDNTGLALFRYAAHADVDLIGRRLSVPVDVNFFTDRERKGALVFSPTEGDVILGLTSTWDVWPGALEVGARFEHDRPLDRRGFSQTYGDLRLRYLYSAAVLFPGLEDALGGGDVSGWFTAGAFLLNPTYAARPDNSGLAFLRYGWHMEISAWKEHVALGLDATMFTDRRVANSVKPTELDFTPEIVGRLPPFDLHLAYERDMPLDRGGLVQEFVYVLVGWQFDLKGDHTPERPRTMVPSP